MVYLSVVIPAYKEVENLQRDVLLEVYDYLKKQKYTWEVLVVDDGSPDKTADVALGKIRKLKNFRILREPHRGKGGTVIAGALAAKGNIVLFTDMDQATPITQLSKILPKFSEGFDIVIGSRSGRKGAPAIRKLMALGFQVLRTIILRLPYRDTQCGFKAFTRESGRDIFTYMKIFSEKNTSRNAGVTAGFDLELLYLARKLNYKVSEVPVIWRYQETERVSAIKDSWEGLRDMLEVRLNALTGKYKISAKTSK